MGFRETVSQTIRKAALGALKWRARTLAERATSELLRPTEHWAAKPQITATVSQEQGEVVVSFSTNPSWQPDDPNSWYVWACYGTRERVAVAGKRGGSEGGKAAGETRSGALKVRLRNPKTQPDSLIALSGGRTGIYFFSRITKSSVAPRRWDRVVARNIAQRPLDYLMGKK